MSNDNAKPFRWDHFMTYWHYYVNNKRELTDLRNRRSIRQKCDVIPKGRIRNGSTFRSIYPGWRLCH